MNTFRFFICIVFSLSIISQSTLAHPYLSTKFKDEYELKPRLQSAYGHHIRYLPKAPDNMHHLYRKEFHDISLHPIWKLKRWNINKHLALYRFNRHKTNSWQYSYRLESKGTARSLSIPNTYIKLGLNNDRSSQQNYIQQLHDNIENMYNRIEIENLHLHTYLGDAYYWLAQLYYDESMLDNALYCMLRAKAHFKKSGDDYSKRIRTFAKQSPIQASSYDLNYFTLLMVAQNEKAVKHSPDQRLMCRIAFHN